MKVRRVAALTLDEACLLCGDTEEVTLWGEWAGQGWRQVLLGQVSFRATVMQIPRRAEESRPMVTEGQGTAVTPESY